MKSKLLVSTLASTLVMAGCATLAPTGTQLGDAPTAAEQQFLASSAMTPHYALMANSVSNNTLDVTATGSATVATGTGTGATVGASAGATVGTGTSTTVSTNPLVTNAMAANATMAQVTLANVTSSSVRSSYFAQSYLTDGNLHSAWGPAAGDTSPTLTFDLKAGTRLRGLGLKQSGGATFDVAVQTDGGAWTVIGTNMTSTATQLDWVDLTATLADKVQLRFHGSNFLVCECQWFGDNGGTTTGGNGSPSPLPSTSPVASTSPAPSTSPSTTTSPSPSPSASTSTDPSASPSASTDPSPSPSASSTDGGTEITDECAIVLAGGNHHHFKFGFDVRHHNAGSDEGSCQLVDLDSNVTVKGTIDHCSFGGATTACTGHTSTGEAFSFTLSGDATAHTCSFHGANVDFDNQSCADIAGNGLNVKVVASVSAWVTDVLDFFAHDHIELHSL